MTRTPYYEQQILQAIPRLGKEGEDMERLRMLAPLFRDNAQATMAACMAVLFPDKHGKAAVNAFKAFRGRVEKAGREASPPFPLVFVVDENRRLGADKRFCRIEGPPQELQFRSLVDDVQNLPVVPNPAYLGKPKIRLVPLQRPHDSPNAFKLRKLLETHLKAHQTCDFQLVDQATVEYCRQNGIRIIPWTVNELSDMERMKTFALDGIITDYPDRLRTVMAARAMPLPPQVSTR